MILDGIRMAAFKILTIECAPAAKVRRPPSLSMFRGIFDHRESARFTLTKGVGLLPTAQARCPPFPSRELPCFRNLACLTEICWKILITLEYSYPGKKLGGTFVSAFAAVSGHKATSPILFCIDPFLLPAYDILMKRVAIIVTSWWPAS